MKGRFESLTINAYGSRLMTRDAGALKFAACKSFCPEDASDQEKRIHKYLDEHKVFMLDAR